MSRKIHYAASVLSLLLIGWAAAYFGEGNLPPLKPAVRYTILFLFFNWLVSFWRLVSSPDRPFERFRVWLWAALPALPLCFLFPVFSGDIMEYLIRGRILGLYHESPYRMLPQDIPQDMLRPYSVWWYNPDAYGPLSIYIQTIPAVLFEHAVRWMIAGYKAIVWIFIAVAIRYFWKITQRLPLEDRGRAWALFAFCPLVWTNGLIDGHNDSILMALSIVSLLYFLEKKYGRAFFFWTCAFLIKYMVILHLPFMILFAVQDKWRREGRFPFRFAAGQFFANALFIVFLFWPLWAGLKTFGAVLRHLGQEEAFYSNTIPYLMEWTLNHLGLAMPSSWVRWGGVLVYGLAYLWLVGWCARTKDLEGPDFYRIVSFAYLGFFAALYSPLGHWYMVWALFWIILARWPQSLWLVTLYSAVGMFAFYKRINFLVVIALVLYGASLMPALRRLRSLR